jgi:hypothetical protein
VTVSDEQRMAIHEAGHAVVAIVKEFFVYGAMLDGPDHNPGAVWRQFPPGKTAETDRDWAGREMRMFMGGYIAERVCLGDNCDNWVNAEGGDYGLRDYCAFQNLEIPEDVALIRRLGAEGRQVAYHLWRRELSQLRWDKYDAVISTGESDVIAILTRLKDVVLSIAQRLLAENHVRGRQLYEAVGVRWSGKTRSADWVNV